MAREELIPPKKLAKGDTKWGTKNTVMGWVIDIVNQLITMTQVSQESITIAIAAIPPKALRFSKRKWFCLLVMLCSADPKITGSARMFSRFHHTLRNAKVRLVLLSAHVHDGMNIWRHLIKYMVERPTHFWDIFPHPPAGTVETFFYLKVMLCVYQYIRVYVI